LWPIWRPDALAADGQNRYASSIKGATHACTIVLAYRFRCVDEHHASDSWTNCGCGERGNTVDRHLRHPVLDREQKGYFKDENIEPTLEVVANQREIGQRVLNGASQFSITGPGRNNRRRHQRRTVAHPRRRGPQAAALSDRQVLDQDLRRSARRQQARCRSPKAQASS
jgi:hypothetical protein